MTFTVRFESHVLTMLGAVAVLAVVSTLAAGKLAIPYFAADRLILVSALTFGYGGILISLVFIASWSRIRSFINPATGQFDVAATLRAYRFPVLPALLMYAATIYGITAAGNRNVSRFLRRRFEETYVAAAISGRVAIITGSSAGTISLTSGLASITAGGAGLMVTTSGGRGACGGPWIQRSGLCA